MLNHLSYTSRPPRLIPGCQPVYFGRASDGTRTRNIPLFRGRSPLLSYADIMFVFGAGDHDTPRS